MALLIQYPADKNPFRVTLDGAYARVTRYEGDKATVGWTDAEVDALFAEADLV